MASSWHIKWDCPECQDNDSGCHKFCSNCRSMLVWTCLPSEKSGLYSNLSRHCQRCNYCSPEREEERKQLKDDKQISKIDDLEILYAVQYPWSEWSRSDNSCKQHTELDLEQVQLLYDMCEQSIVEYCANRKQQLTQNTSAPFLSPINLLSVTLWYSKHYHSERYIAEELHFNQTAVNYFLSAMIDTIYRCEYPKRVVLPDDMDDEDTTHGPEQYHKLIVDSTCIPTDQPEDREERKTYYHGKSPTNYGFKVQIACGFRHRIVHVSEFFKGSVHDLTILRESGLLEYVEDNVQIIADKGYTGEPYVVTPRKKPRGGELTTEDKDFNRNICSARAAIENLNQRMKQYAIIGHVYRGSYDDFDKITKIARIVSALCNLNLDRHPIRKD